MKRIVALVAALVLALLPFATFAQSYTSGFQIQNQGTGPATVTVSYIGSNGASVADQTGTIPAGQSVTFFPLGAPPAGWTGGTVPAGFNGSVVISANQPVAAVANTVAPNFSYADSYNGVSQGDTNVSLPLIQRNNEHNKINTHSIQKSRLHKTRILEYVTRLGLE